MKRQRQYRLYSKSRAFHQSSSDSATLAACITRFTIIYPFTEIEDWYQLIKTEALLLSSHELKVKLEPLAVAQFCQENEQRKQRGMPGLFSTGLPCKDMDRVHEILRAVVAFVDAFTLVFHCDWDTTKDCIVDATERKVDDVWFGKNGTFAYPTMFDVSNNWCNRGHLLDSYSKLLKLLYGLENSTYHPDGPGGRSDDW
jgi:hypothetical protein